MLVKELIKRLEEMPQDMEVYMAERTSDFRYGLLSKVLKREIIFSEHCEGEVLSREEVVILDEDI